MGDGTNTGTDVRERRASLGLWSVPGVGPRALESLRAFAGGALAPLLDAAPAQWASAVEAPPAVRAALAEGPALEERASRLEQAAAAAGMGICFPGDAAWPARLSAELVPVLFFQGTPCPPRRWAALVGSRHPETGFLPQARRFAREVAEAGLGIISGAAEGVDQACHWGALDAGAPTWAFVGAGLDQLDPPQARLRPHVLERGGMFFSEFPPGVRANRTTFPRRNRLIAGAADAVVVLRAARESGALHTAEYALRLGRPLLALPGDRENPAAEGCLTLISQGAAGLCTGAGHVLQAVGGQPALRAAAVLEGRRQDALSARAEAVLAALAGGPRGMDELLEAVALGPSEISAGLVELELAGRCIQRPGRTYEQA